MSFTLSTDIRQNFTAVNQRTNLFIVTSSSAGCQDLSATVVTNWCRFCSLILLYPSLLTSSPFYSFILHLPLCLLKHNMSLCPVTLLLITLYKTAFCFLLFCYYNKSSLKSLRNCYVYVFLSQPLTKHVRTTLFVIFRTIRTCATRAAATYITSWLSAIYGYTKLLWVSEVRRQNGSGYYRHSCVVFFFIQLAVNYRTLRRLLVLFFTDADRNNEHLVFYEGVYACISGNPCQMSLANLCPWVQNLKMFTSGP